MPKDAPAEVKFSTELLNLFNRWDEESDLTPLEMAEIAVIVINNVCGDGAIEFEADDAFFDGIEEE